MNITTAEMRLLLELGKDRWNDSLVIERKSDREFDLAITGHNKQLKCAFSAWLVLAAIRELTMWPSWDIANMTDYPEMTKEGDWSGVRDTDENKLWNIFYEYVVPQI